MKLSEMTLPILIVLLIVLYGSQALMGEFSQAYNQKVSMAPALIQGDIGVEESLEDTNLQKTYIVSVIENLKTSVKGSDSATKRVIAYSFGETDLRYHFRLKSGDFVPTTLDLSTNILYNYSYIVNTPSKLIHNIKADFTLGDQFSEGLTGVFAKGTMYIFLIWDVLHAITGFFCAVLMLFIGWIPGLLFHPIQSILNIFPVIWNLITTTWHAVVYIFNLFR
ncbi:hypothetical protein MKY63_10760 [Paenibacillus sp. FSL R7-0189]|uniref:hypothetical protein n=1 Tax=Paenibacillus sp. FSL R7-0189 TaxID=2921673 RepID=UPI0030DB4371